MGVAVTDGEKHSCLLRYGIDNNRKKFYTSFPKFDEIKFHFLKKKTVCRKIFIIELATTQSMMSK
jgi:hypothetical protein